MVGSAHITTSDGMMYVSKFGAAPVSFKFDPSFSIGPSCKTSATFLFVLFSFLPDLLRFQAFKSGFQTFFLFKNCAICTTVFILPIYMINLI